MSSKRHQRRRATAGNKQHLFEGNDVSPELLRVHRELEVVRAGARVNRSHEEQARHLDERLRKLQEVS